MSSIASSTGITVDKQVLLITGGEALDPADRVCNYSNAGTVSTYNQGICHYAILSDSSKIAQCCTITKGKVDPGFLKGS